MEQFIWLLPLGFIVGAFGTLIGAGGGFILVPVLLLLYKDMRPEAITGLSLVVVFFNAFSGSAAYAGMKRIDYKSGIMFAAATVPGSILGALTTAFIPRRFFDAIFGLLLLAVSIFLMRNPENVKGGSDSRIHKGPMIQRNVTDREGTDHAYSYNPVTGMAISLFTGYFSSLLGIGGGIIHVPVLVHLLNFPVHIATATSHFILAVMALSGSLVHILSGVISKSVVQTVALSIGALAGAQVGARLSNRLKGKAIIRSLAAALGVVAVRILAMAFYI